MTVKHPGASAQARHTLSIDPLFASEVDRIPAQPAAGGARWRRTSPTRSSTTS